MHAASFVRQPSAAITLVVLCILGASALGMFESDAKEPLSATSDQKEADGNDVVRDHLKLTLSAPHEKAGDWVDRVFQSRTENSFTLDELRDRLPIVSVELVRASAEGFLYWDAIGNDASNDVCIVYPRYLLMRTEFPQRARLLSGAELIAEWDPFDGDGLASHPAQPFVGQPVVSRNKILIGNLTMELWAILDSEEHLLFKIPLCNPVPDNVFFR